MSPTAPASALPGCHSAPPLKTHFGITTSDLHGIARAAGRAQIPVDIQFASRGQRFTFSLDHHPMDRMAITRAAFRSNEGYRVDSPPAESHYMVQLPLRGSYTVWHGGRRIRAQAGRYGAVLGPHEATRWSGRRGFEEITVEVDRHALEDCWRRLTGEDTTSPIPIHPTLPLDTEHGHLLLRIIRSMTTRLEFGPSLGGGASALEEFFLQTLLAPAAHHACQDPAALAPMGDAHLARRAEVFLEDEAHRAPTIAAVAEHHAVSIRTLQRAFLRHQGVTPRAFLRQVRFERARSRLQRGRDAHVTDVALSLGFTHLGRFSVEYRRRYGETPSATLHGHRAPDRSLDVALRIAAGDASASNGNGRGREGACGFCGCV